MAIIRPFHGKSPRLADSAFAVDDAVVVGDVEIGADSSIWFGSVLRGDVHFIRVGARTNIQDHSVLHVTGGTHPTIVGDDVTVGHRVVLHGCTVKDRSLVGIGAIVLDGAVVEEEAMVGAGSLVTPGTVVPSHTLVLGAPARVRRALTPAEIAYFRESAESYAARARVPRAGVAGPMTALDALAGAPLFEGMGETGLRIFAGIARERALAAGERLFAQGDEAEGLFVVKSGKLRVLARAAGGEREVATLGPGDHVGELALLAPGERLVSAEAAAPTEVVELSRRAFFKTAQERPQACLKLSLLIAADLARRVAGARDALQGALARAAERPD